MIRKITEIFAWQEQLDNMTYPNEQVELLNEVLLDIYSNFIPNKVATIRPRQAPWITQAIKNFLRRKTRAYKSFVRNGRPENMLEDA